MSERVLIDGVVRDIVPVAYGAAFMDYSLTGRERCRGFSPPVFDIPGYDVVEVIGGAGYRYVAYRTL